MSSFFSLLSFPILKQFSYPKNIAQQNPSKSSLHFLPLCTLSLSVFLSLVYRKATCESYLHSVSPIPLLFTHEPTLITLLPVFLHQNCPYQIHLWLPYCQIQWLIPGSHVIYLVGSIWHYLLFFPHWTLSSLDFQDTIFSLSGCSVSNIFATFTLSSWLLNIGISQGSVLGPLLFNKCSTHAENSYIYNFNWELHTHISNHLLDLSTWVYSWQL